MELKTSEAETFWLALFACVSIFAIALVGPSARLATKAVEWVRFGVRK